MQYKKVSTESGVGQLPQLDQSFHPINLMRMNHRVVLFLIVCNGTSADSLMVPALVTCLITQWGTTCLATIFNHHMGNHLRPILVGSL